jgi:hypothetical protein
MMLARDLRKSRFFVAVNFGEPPRREVRRTSLPRTPVNKPLLEMLRGSEGVIMVAGKGVLS